MIGRLLRAPALGALASLCLLACSTGELAPASEAPDESAVEQHADGCGAFRYRGSANVFCEYQGVRNETTITTLSGTCINDSQLSCSYDYTCHWLAPVVTSDCVDHTNVCDAYPPEASLSDPPAYIENLPSGSTLCDPPASAADLRYYCDHSAWSRALSFARTFCAQQTSVNSGGVTCCLNCAKPTPLPGATATTTACEGDECSCYGEGEGSGGGGEPGGGGSGIGSAAP